MFEVLLQAEKALASGALDQAERSYWQLIVLDPTNAIAVAGLARVSLDRGDQLLARTFAERALVIDPDNFAAKRIVETLEGRGVQPPASDEPDLPLLAAHRLEALGRRRAPGQTGHKNAETHSPVPPPAAVLVAVPVAAPVPAPVPVAVPAPAPAFAPRPRPQTPRGPKAHQALGDRARRHRLPETMKPPTQSEDPFAVAESEAAVEAVDEAADVVLAHPFEPAEGGARTDELSQVLGAIGATDEEESIALRVALVSDAAQLEAAEVDAAVDAAELRAAERRESELNEAELEAAESLAAESVGPVPSRRIDLVALEAELRLAELRVAQGEPDEPEAAQTGQTAQATPAIEEGGAVEPVEPIAPARAKVDLLTSESALVEAEPAPAESALAEAEPAESALAEAEPFPAEPALAESALAESALAEAALAEAALAPRVSEQIGEAEFDAAQLETSGAPIGSPTRPAPPHAAPEPTEEDAEEDALREALAVVLGNDTDDAPTEDGERAPQGTETVSAQPPADADNEPPLDWSDHGGDTAGSEAAPKRHRHGLLRRFLGD